MSKKSLAVGIVFFLVISSVPYSILSNEISTDTFGGNILYVGGSGLGNYSSIQNAVDNASDGDTVFVYNGTYNEFILIEKSMNLKGENKNTTIIYGNNGSRHIIFVTKDFVNITGFTVQYGNDGIRVKSSYVKIIDNKISANNYGLNIYPGSFERTCSCLVKDNIISNNKYVGIEIHMSNKNNIIGNMVNYNQYDGITLIQSASNNLSYNTINNNKAAGIFGIKTHENTILENIIQYNGRHYKLINSGIHFNLCSNNFLKGNSIMNNKDEGIELNLSSNNYFEYNTISNNSHSGIYIHFPTIGNSPNYFYKNNIFNNSKDKDYIKLQVEEIGVHNRWKYNYWGDWIGLKYRFLSFLPYYISGFLFFNFDWHPATEPYDISMHGV